MNPHSIAHLTPQQLNALRERIRRDGSYYRRLANRLQQWFVRDRPTHVALCRALRAEDALRLLDWAVADAARGSDGRAADPTDWLGDGI
ncbi:MAG TPA: hypothetical protein VK324_04530 [Tepidisphaeraceae bacterium]|nr:hypothetical protein [Tepidisphaeraceae bacterium]